jgi:hypothetical protein
MFDLLMLGYIAVLVVCAVLVSAYFPNPSSQAALPDFGPIGTLVMFAFMLTPSACAFLLPDYLRTWLSPFIRPDWAERLAQLVTPFLAFYIVLRGIVVWAIILLVAGASWAFYWALQYIAGKYS